MLMAMELAQELTARPGYTWTIANPKYLKALKVFTGTSSSLSLLGALTVIVFQACGSSLWPNKAARNIVVMLSVSDLIVAISHLWGVSQDFDKLLDIHYPNDTADIQCTTQAVLAVFGTLASFMWTLALVSFVFFTYCMKAMATLCQKSTSFILYNILCWGVPLLVVIILGKFYLLGYAEGVDIVWCYITMTSSPDDTVALVFGYEVWTWLILTGIMISIIGYLITHLCKKKGYCCYQQQPELKSLNKSSNSDSPVTAPDRLKGYEKTYNNDLSNSANKSPATTIQKPEEEKRSNEIPRLNLRLILAGVLLLVLRLPSTIVDIALLANKSLYKGVPLGLLIIISAVGDSIQGLVNACLFVWCTPQVCNKCPKCRFCKCFQFKIRRKGYQAAP